MATFFYRRPQNFRLFLAMVYLLVLLNSGLWCVPTVSVILRIAHDIHSNPYTGILDYQWNIASFLCPALAYLTGFNQGLHVFVLFYFLLLTAAFFLVFTLAARGRTDAGAPPSWPSPACRCPMSWLISSAIPTP